MNYKKGTQTRGCMKGVMRYVSQPEKTLWNGQQLTSGIATVVNTKAHDGEGYILTPFFRAQATDLNFTLSLALISIFSASWGTVMPSSSGKPLLLMPNTPLASG